MSSLITVRDRGKLSLSDDLLQHEDLSCQPSPAAGELCDTLVQGFSKFTFKGPNGNYHQRQKVRNNCYYKTCVYKHAYYFI